jgi:hypothetical protein
VNAARARRPGGFADAFHQSPAHIPAPLGFQREQVRELANRAGYPSLGYEVTILPKVGVHERADFVLHTLTEKPTSAARRPGGWFWLSYVITGGLERPKPLADHGLHGARCLGRPCQISEIDDEDKQPDGFEVEHSDPQW